MAIDAPPKDQPSGELEFVRQWMEAIDLSSAEEKDWRATADRACDAYRGGMPNTSTTDTNLNTFNLFHANVETLVPALYNSTPIPDVRRRFNDSDPVAKEVSEIFERSLSYQVDAYDFDQTILSSVRDMAITSRGLVRARYEPTFDSEGMVDYERVTCEYVPWRMFRRGPGKSWPDVPWIAFELYLSYNEVSKLLEGEKDKAGLLKEMRFSYSAEPKKNAEQQGENLSKIASRARVWEIWDKDNREVHFICPDYTAKRLVTIDDPLKLSGFFPIPRPLSAIMAPDSLVPITLLQIYETLLTELNVVQRRITSLTAQLRARGWYAGLNDTDIQSAASANDGELSPLTGAEAFLTTGKGIDSAITYWPIETIAKTLAQLVQQRELIKQTIYEVTGLSDIVRGASDARETATAQQLKSQWGSLRIQRMQAEVGRFARDLFRIKAEIMANRFSLDSLLQMSGQQYPTQEQKQLTQIELQRGQEDVASGRIQPSPELEQKAKQAQELLAKPSREEIEQLIRQGSIRGFRVDIESDSTIRGDIQRNQEQMSLFLQGTAQYLSAVGPLVQQGAMPQDLAIEIYAGFARTFRLGKQAEDALDRLADEARKGVGQPKPPSPDEVKAQAEQKKLEMEMAFKEREFALKQKEKEFDLLMKQKEMELRERELQMEAAIKQADLDAKMQESQMRREDLVADLQFKQQDRELALDSRNDEIAHKRMMADTEREIFTNKAGRELELMNAKGDQEMAMMGNKAENEMRLRGAAGEHEMAMAEKSHMAEMHREAQKPKPEPKDDDDEVDLSPILKALEKLDGRLDKLESKKPATARMVRDKEGRLEAIVQQ